MRHDAFIYHCPQSTHGQQNQLGGGQSKGNDLFLNCSSHSVRAIIPRVAVRIGLADVGVIQGILNQTSNNCFDMNKPRSLWVAW